MIGFKKKSYPITESKTQLLNATSNGKLFITKVGNLDVCFAQYQNELVAFRNKCPHQGKSLEGGACKEGKIICPVHQYQFDVETGRGHGDAIEKYDLQLDGEKAVLIREVFSLF